MVVFTRIPADAVPAIMMDSLLESLEAPPFAAFVDFVSQEHVQPHLSQEFQRLTFRELQILAASLHKAVVYAASLLPPTPQTEQPHEAGQSQADAAGHQPTDRQDSSPSTLSLLSSLVKIVSDVASLCFLSPDRSFAPPEPLVSSLHFLHDLLLRPSVPSDVKETLARLFESWWAAQLPGREGLVTHTLPYLLAQSLDLQSTATVKRVFDMREALSLLDFEQASIEGIRTLLVRCAFARPYLHCRRVSYKACLQAGTLRYKR